MTNTETNDCPSPRGAVVMGSAQELRCRAEETLRQKATKEPKDQPPMSAEETKAALHELRVHQIELETQNEELRAAQAKIEASRERYVELYDLAPVAYITLSENGLILEANHTAATLLGMARGALINRPISGFILKEDQNNYYLHRKKLFENGQRTKIELRLVKPDGGTFWAQMILTTAQSGDGEPVCRIVINDISESKQAAEVLLFLAQASSAGFGETFFNKLAPYLALTLNMDFVCIDRLEGDGLTARTVSVWCDGHFEDNVTYALKDTPCGDVVGKTVCCFPASVCQFFPHDQVLHDLRAESYVGVTLFDNVGHPIGLIAVIGRKPLQNRPLAEATMKMVAVRAAGEMERLDAEEALRGSESRIRAITNSVRDAILVMDPGGLVSFWNPAAERIFGYTAEDSLGRNLHQLIAPQHYHAAHNAAFERFQRTGKGNAINRTLELTANHKNGQEIAVELSLSALHFVNGWHTVGIIRDITDRKHIEEENKTLQAQLQQAQKMEAIGTLAGGIAHDFNNILGAILGYAEMIQEDTPAGSRLRSDSDQVVKASRRAKELVKQILAFSRQAEADHIPLQPALIIKEAVKMLRSSLPTTIDMRQDIDSEVGLILADPIHIHQILVNLCSNAWHAMEQTGGILTVSLKSVVLSRDDLINQPQIEPGCFAHLSVGDTGPGIAPEIQERIFDPYFTTKEVGKGTGMGLAIIYGIVTSSKGFITCHSLPGEGAIFHVYLPVIKELALPDLETVSYDIDLLGDERILFIDDEEMLATMGKFLLERLGYRVTVRQSSIEALNTFQREPEQFDLVITDQTMPGMTGIDLARRILQIRPDIPIILCTGYSSVILENEAKSQGIKDLAMKPLAKNDLAALIRKVLTKLP